MAVTHSEPQPDSGVPFPETVPRLPIIQFSPADPAVRMHYALTGATDASQFAPDDAFYDVRGILLERSGDTVRPGLTAGGEAEPDALRERTMGVLRDMFDRAGLDESEAAEIESVLSWLDSAPTLAHMLHGMGFAPVSYLRANAGGHGHRCINCTSWERITHTRSCC